MSVSRSRLKLPAQSSFLVCHALGVAVGIVYNSETPELYEYNAHHRLGWVVNWVVMGQMLMGIVTVYFGRERGSIVTRGEHEALIPVSIDALAKHHRMHPVPQPCGYRYSNDSGQGTERASSSLRSHSLSSIEEANNQQSVDPREDIYNVSYDDPNSSMPEKSEPLHHSKIRRFLPQRVPILFSAQVFRLIDLMNNTLDRVILVLGFVAIATGAATYYGLFVSHPSPAPAGHLYSWLSARKSDFQWSCTLRQGRYLLLVRATHFRSLDGLFCRDWLGLEYETTSERGRV